MACKYGRAHLVINVLYFMLVCGSCFSNHDKRILLSDPDYVQQQMTHLQSELQTLQATVQSQNGELQTLQTTVQSQNVKISSLEQQLSYSNNGGASFVRWGRTDCPANLTELVYSGYAGGSWYYDTGAAADRLCLPPDPEWLQTTVVPDDYTGRIYGAEYESSSGHTLFGDDSHNEEIPCAVCRSKYFASSVMIPARTTCYSGWTKAYGGSLTSGHYGHAAATEYLCVDEHAQPLVGGGNTNDDGALFYGVKAFCGSLRCPPYKENKYISCVVCMK
ncbi:short-chain collagen C4-like isoform X2 [Pecten maximus]|uniref:short-chain collagen C4-like isoform X2 n=1 Tax=Pecten maximus TaxID=6579 RepID=UPI0014590466|nr:short-chain collagen C4-like isoform X2 [Pecten maximus]